MKVDIFNWTYKTVNGKPVIYLIGRDEDRERVVLKEENFKPKFFVHQSEKMNAPAELKGLDPDTFNKLPLSVVELDHPADVYDERKKYNKTWEADVPFAKRYAIEEEIYCGMEIDEDTGETRVDENHNIDPRIWYMDIETDTSSGMANPDNPEARVLVISIYDSYDEEVFSIHHKDEQVLFNNFLKEIKERDPDILTGWNFCNVGMRNTNGFDFPYIVNRMKRINVDPSLMSPVGKINEHSMEGRNVFDLMTAYKRFFYGKKFDSFALVETAKRDGVVDDPFQFDYDKMNMDNYRYEDNIDEIAKHCEEDVLMTKGIDDEWGIISMFDMLSRIVGDKLSRTLSAEKYIDTLMLRKFYEQDIARLPTKEEHEDEDYEGAIVLEPDSGKHKGVAVYDFSKLYPYSMIAKNISPDTYRSEEPSDPYYEVKGNYFLKESEGVVPQIFKTLIDTRNDVKEEMKTKDPNSNEYERLWNRQFALKSVTNAVYGYFGYKYSRLYSREIADSTTYIGRKQIERAKDWFEERSYNVVYGDTDSCFVQIGDLEKSKELEPKVNSIFDDFELEFEKYYSSFFIGDVKKRYAGHLTYKDGKERDEIDATGYEILRSDSSKLAREVQEELFERWLRQDQSKDEIRKWLINLSEEIKEIDPKKYAKPQPMSKEPEKYGTMAMRKAVIYANKFLDRDLGEGDRPLKIYVDEVTGDKPTYYKLPNGRKYKVDDVILNEDGSVPEGFKPDYDRHLDMSVGKKLSPFLQEMDLSWQAIKSGKEQTKISGW